MRFLEFAKRNFLMIWRDPIALGFLLGMPIAFMLIFGFAFGEEKAGKVRIGVIDRDRSPVSVSYTKMLSKFPPDAPYFEVVEFEGEDEARERIKDGDIMGYVLIPEDFGEKMEGGGKIPLKVVYDETKQWFALRAVSIIRASLIAFLGIEIPVDINAEGLKIDVERSYFNFLAPGMIIYGLMIIIPTVVRVMAEDKERGFLRRLMTTPFKGRDFILGYYLAFVPIIVIQIGIYLVFAFLMGLHVVGNIGLVFLSFFLIGLSSLGFGLIIGSLARTHAQGEPLCWIFLVPMAMISGAWFPVEGMHPFLLGLAKFFPFYWACESSRRVISLGASLDIVSSALLIMAGWTFITLLIGTLLFRMRTLRL